MRRTPCGSLENTNRDDKPICIIQRTVRVLVKSWRSTFIPFYRSFVQNNVKYWLKRVSVSQVEIPLCGVLTSIRPFKISVFYLLQTWDLFYHVNIVNTSDCIVFYSPVFWNIKRNHNTDELNIFWPVQYYKHQRFGTKTFVSPVVTIRISLIFSGPVNCYGHQRFGTKGLTFPPSMSGIEMSYRSLQDGKQLINRIKWTAFKNTVRR